MSVFFGGGGGLSSGGSWKSNVDNYYAYTQTSGGGGGSGGKGCGTISSTIIIVILVAVAIQNIVAALIVIGCICLIGLIIYLIIKQQAISNQKKNEVINQRNANSLTEEKHDAVNNLVEKTDATEPISKASDSQEVNKLAAKHKPNGLIRLSQDVKDYRSANPEWEGGIFFDFVNIAGSGFIENLRGADGSTSVGDKLELKREPLNSYDSNAIAIYNKTGIKLGYVPKKYNVKPAQLMDSGKELFARLHSKRKYTHVLGMSIEIFIKN